MRIYNKNCPICKEELYSNFISWVFAEFVNINGVSYCYVCGDEIKESNIKKYSGKMK